MTAKQGPVWSQEDTRRTLQGIEESVAEVLAAEIPSDLTEDQRVRLRRHLSEGLKADAAHGARRLARRFLEEERRRERVEARRRRDHREPGVERLSLHVRIQHMVLFTSCILLIVTGLPIKFHEAAFSAWFIGLLGGPEVTGLLHRVGAIALTGIGLYHLFYSMAFEAGRRDFGLLIPKLQDAKDALHQIGFFLGFKKDKPLYGRFSYIEKFDYWAVYWGMVVMITSGFILWFKDAAINQFGKFAYDIGREAHSDEALLATLAIVIWHFYNVHFNPKRFPGSLTWWNGRITLEEFKEEHSLEYEAWRAEGRLPSEESGAASPGKPEPGE